MRVVEGALDVERRDPPWQRRPEPAIARAEAGTVEVGKEERTPRKISEKNDVSTDVHSVTQTQRYVR